MVSCPQIKIFYNDSLTQLSYEMNNFVVKSLMGGFATPSDHIKVNIHPVIRERSKGAGGVMIRTTGGATGTQSETHVTQSKCTSCSCSCGNPCDCCCTNTQTLLDSRDHARSRTITLNTHIIGDYDSVLRLPRESGIMYLHDTFTYFRWIGIVQFVTEAQPGAPT